jgi:valyl-tRNA synthetase
MLHPVMPYITEELYHRLFPNAPTDLMVSEWEDGADWPRFPEAEERMARLQALIDAVRTVRGEMNVPPGARVSLLVKTEDERLITLLDEYQGYFANLANVEGLRAGPQLVKPRGSAAAAVGDVELYLPLEGIVDFAAEAARLEKDLGNKRTAFNKVGKRLANEAFLNKAPAEVVQKERDKRDKLSAEIEALEKHLAQVRELL